MAITTEIIGKLGGRVEAIPVSGKASGNNGTSVVLATIDVPAGEQWLVAVAGRVAAGSTNIGNLPSLRIGEYMARRESGNQSVGLAAVVTETTDVELIRNTWSNSDSFTGHVYTVKL